MTTNCIYCAKQTSAPYAVFTGKGKRTESFPCCSEECKQKAGRYFRLVHYFTWLFFGMIVCAMLLFLAVGLEFSSELRLAAAGVALLGICCLLFPFPVSSMVESWGIRKSARIIRIAGAVLLLAGGIWMAFLWQ